MILCVGDEKVAASICSEPSRIIQRRLHGWTAVTGCARKLRKTAIASDGGDDARRRNFSYAAIERIRDEQIVCAIHGQAAGAIQRGSDGEAAIAGKSRIGVACNGVEHSVGRYLPNAVAVGDEQVTRAVHRKPLDAA